MAELALVATKVASTYLNAISDEKVTANSCVSNDFPKMSLAGIDYQGVFVKLLNQQPLLQWVNRKNWDASC